jgi:hypothetical protein
MPKAERFFSCFLLRLRLLHGVLLANSKFDEKAAAKVRDVQGHSNTSFEDKRPRRFTLRGTPTSALAA